MRRTRFRIWTLSLTLVALALIGVVVVVAASRLLVQAVPGYRDDIEREAGAAIARRVTIHSLDLSWRRFRPNLDLLDVIVYDETGQQPALRLRQLNIGIDWFALLTGRMRVAELRVAGVTLTVERLSDGSLRVSGISTEEPLTEEDVRRALREIKRIRRLVVADSQVLWLDYTDPDTFHRIDDINLLLRSRGGTHRLDARATLPVDFGGKLVLDAKTRGDLERYEELETEAELVATGLEPGGWLKPWLRRGLALQGDDTRIELVSRWQGLRLVSAAAELESGQLQVLRGGRAQPLLNDLHSEFRVESVDRGWRIAIDRLMVAAPRREAVKSRGVVGFYPALEGKPLIVGGRLDQLQLNEIGECLGLLELEDQRWLSQLRPAGRLHDLRFRLERPAEITETAPLRYSLQARFDGLGVSDDAERPGFAGATGRLKLDQNGGGVTLMVRNGQLIAPRTFDQPLPIAQLAGDIGWKRSGEDWQVSSRELRWRGPGDLSGRSSLELKIFGDDSSPHMVLDTQFAGTTIDAIRPFVPRVPDVLDEEVRVWLRQSIVSGKVSQGRLQVRGTLEDFPYQNADEPGLFRIDFDVRDGVLNYAEGWPIIDHINTHVAFQGRRMDIDAKSGRILGEPVRDVHGEVKDFYVPLLEIGGTTNADTGKMLSFLTASPLRPDYEALVQALNLQGPARLDLKLEIPLDNLEATRVFGLVTTDGKVQLNHAKLPEPLTGITGQLRFDNGGVTARDLHAQLMGLKLVAQLDPELRGREHMIRFRAVSGTAFPRDANALARMVPPAALKFLSGATQWHADMLFDASAKPAQLALSSDLGGLAIDLPAPFGKTAQETVPLSIRLDPSSASEMHADISYGPLLRAALALDDSGEQWSINRGLVRLGGTPAALPRSVGLWVDGSLPVLDLEPWQSLLGKPAAAPVAKPAPAPGPSLLRGANLQFGALKFSNQSFENIGLQLAQETGDWVLRARAPALDGSARWPVKPRGRIVYQVDLDKIVLRAREQGKTAVAEEEEAEGPPRDPALLPGLSLNCRSLQVNDFSMGTLQMEVAPVTNGVELTRFSLNGDLKITAAGAWSRVQGSSRANLALDIKGRKLQPMFTALGYTPSIEAESAEVLAKLIWAPHPEGVKTEALGGTLSLDLKRGELLAVEPGAGRVLGLLNFYALPRRLTLDFRDVLSEGLAFDTLKGDFRIEQGNAWTSNLQVRGPSLQMEIEGRVGLAARDYDQQVTIHPQTSAGVALVGAAAGGPAVGLALLLAQRLFKKPLEELSEINYRLTGSWDDPDIDKGG